MFPTKLNSDRCLVSPSEVACHYSVIDIHYRFQSCCQFICGDLDVQLSRDYSFIIIIVNRI